MSRTTTEQPSTRGTSRDTPSNGRAAMHQTRHDLPAKVRTDVAKLLNKRLADCIDLQLQCKQAHWNVKGPSFIGLHKLFDDVHKDVSMYVDEIAERIVQLGGTADGTARHVAERSSLEAYPTEISDQSRHAAALSDAIAQFARMTREAIDETDDRGDAGTADMLTDISRGLDKWLWFVEAHLQGSDGR